MNNITNGSTNAINQPVMNDNTPVSSPIKLTATVPV